MNKVTMFSTYEKLSQYVADIIEEIFKKSFRMSFPKLVLPTGSTPLGLYKELVKRELDWSNISTFNLDEYIMNPDHPYSYHSFMKENLFNKINIYPNNYHFPFRPTLAYEDKMIVNKGIDLCILGIGNNGHIAFNEPGSSFNSRTRVVDLDEQTIQDNSRFFDSVDDVPKQAITMGLGTIMESKRIVLMAQGKHKKGILDRAMFGEITEDIPASILQTHNNMEAFYCD
jgi:glucosamine-6-phosphate deaminase